MYVNVSFATHPDGVPQTIIVMVCRVGVFFGSTKQKCASICLTDEELVVLLDSGVSRTIR